MYDLNDTIVAVSSPNSQEGVIIRMTGSMTVEICEQIFSLPISSCVMRDAYREKGKTTDAIRKLVLSVVEGTQYAIRNSCLMAGSIAIDEELKLDARLYLTFGPNSYTGDDVAEFHIYTNSAVTEAFMSSMLGRGLRMAGPGEFTARAYLAGKIDLAQAEAVNEVVVSSNTFQLAAAEKLLSGRLAEAAAKTRTDLMDCLSLIEAGLDFSGEDIELVPHFARRPDSRRKTQGQVKETQNGNPFITQNEAVKRLSQIKTELERLLTGSIRSEIVVDLPAVGIAGAPNAGKSSLLNKLLGEARSIISYRRKTTRDVLTGLLSLAHCRCVLFDCAGLIAEPNNILDELAQQAAIEALRNSSVVVFCVDVSKEDWFEDVAIRLLIKPEVIIAVATKTDLLSKEILANRFVELNKIFTPLETQRQKSLTGFDAEFLPTSIVTGVGMEQLRDSIDGKLIELSLGTRSEELSERTSEVALTARHKQAVTDAIENVSEAINELKDGSDEVTAMMLRTAYQSICDIESTTGGHVDEQILERIFSRFCIGK